MDAPRKRQKVSSACERCHKRKLGCDPTRPCQLCHRAGVPCVSRRGSERANPSALERQANERVSPSANPNRDEEPVILPESSIVDVSVSMLPGQSLAVSVKYDTSALPGGANRSPISPSRHNIPWREAVGVSLPSKQSLDHSVDCFFSAVDWFMMVFHEETFRQRYEELMKSTYVPVPENDNNLWVILLVLGMGAHYSSLAIMQPREKVAVQQLSKDLIQRIDQQFLRIIDSADEEAVQVCVLLGSFYLFNGRPTAGLGILGSGIKIAQVLRLHREDAIMGISAARLESHRRSWWALEVFDKYAAIAFGRPCSIDDSDCNVGTVTHIRADMQEQPRQAAQLEYHQWKFRLYRIMGPFLGRRLQTNRIASIKSIHAQLVSWQNQLPQYLRLEEYKDKGILKGPSLLQMQALCLQLTYDNIQIILHRSLAFRAGSQLSSADRSPTDLPSSALSREQLFQSAVRTSDLYDYRRILQACRKTHATMHVGICLFTAGVVLCAFAISEPLSARSQTAKRGVMNILRFQRDHILDGHLLSAQSVKILEGLVAVVMRSEQGFIRGDKISPLTASSTPTEEGLQQTIGEVAGARTFSGPRIGQLGYSHMGNLVEESSDHVQEPLLSVPEGTGDEDIDTRGLSDRPELEWLSMDSAAGVMWTGGNPYFTDPGFADASQLWLWSDKPDVQPFLS